MQPSEICFLVSYDDKYEDIAKISVHENIRRYCTLHGYTLWIDRHHENPNGRDPQWRKIQASLEILEKENFKWIFFMDADCLIMNPTIKLEDFINDKYSFIIPAHGMVPPDNPVLNPQGTNMVITSHYFVKNDEIGKQILQEIWDAPDWPNYLHINKFDHEGRQARITLNKEKFKPYVNIIEEKLLNRFWYINSPFMTVKNPGVNENVWQPGDFTVHVTGYSLKDRQPLISDLDYFSGGATAGFRKDHRGIIFTPTQNLKNVSIILCNTNRDELINYFFEDLNVKVDYIMYTNESVNSIDLVIKTIDSDNNLIGLYLLEK